jgi:hypothetical protein
MALSLVRNHHHHRRRRRRRHRRRRRLTIEDGDDGGGVAASMGTSISSHTLLRTCWDSCRCRPADAGGDFVEGGDGFC